MVQKLNPFHQQLWRSPQSVQIGLGESAVVLEQVSANQQRFIDALRHGFADSQLAAVANQTKLPFLQAQELLARLDSVLLDPVLFDPGAEANQQAIWRDADTAGSGPTPEYIRASLDRSASGAAILRGRAKRRVLVAGVDTTSLYTAQLLLRSGVGNLLVRPVLRSALLDHGASPADLTNIELAKASTFREVALVVHSGQQVLDPKDYRHWISHSIPQLGICYQPTGVQVSSVRRPLENGCFRCEHLENCDADPEWAVLAAQLLTSELRFDDSPTISVASGLAAHQALRWLDQLGGFEGNPPNEDFGYRFSSVTGQVSQVPQTRHKDCDCLQLAQQLKIA